MGMGRLVRVTASLHSLSPADGKFRVKDRQPPGFRPCDAILLHQEPGGTQSKAALHAAKKRSRVNGRFLLGRRPAISDNIAAQSTRFSGRNTPGSIIASDKGRRPANDPV